MAKRVLVLAAGPNALDTLNNARHLGYYTIAVAGDPGSPLLAAADEAFVADYLDPAEIARAARRARVDGIYPAPEPAMLAVARAAAQLGLPGIAPEAMALLQNKLAMCEALGAQGLPNPRFRAVRSIEQAEAAARELGAPLIVKPADSFASKGVRQLDHLEDMPLAFTQALGNSCAGVVLLESVMAGQEVCVEGVVQDRALHVVTTMGKERSNPPYCFARGVYAPGPLDVDTRDRVMETVNASLDALGLTAGYVHVETIVSPEAVGIIEVAPYPAAARLPQDLALLAHGVDTTAICLSMAVGDRPDCTHRFKRAAALFWIPSRSGVITEIQGVEEARAAPGIEEVVVTARRGDVMRHAADCASRDRVGYVLATGDSAAQAINRACHARDLCVIQTSQTLE